MAKLATGGFEVAALTRSWHGMTAGSQMVTFAAGRRGHGPTPPGVFALPAPYAYRCPIRHCAGTCDRTCLEAGFDLFDQQSVGAPAAVIAEPVLSAGGVIVPPPGYFTRLLELCHDRGMMLILDEAQTGFGRLGAMFGMDVYDVVPDFLTVSKTLGGGLPISAVATSAALERTAHDHGFMYVTSHVSDPLPAAAALAVLEVVEREDLPARARERGRHLQARLTELQERHEQIGDVRGMGLMWGVELVHDRTTRRPADELGAALTDECQRCGLSINLVRGQADAMTACLRVAPSLTVTEDEIDRATDILDTALTKVTASGP
jgi:2,2-dialkylglycine decarboxylase (pyruvate)